MSKTYRIVLPILALWLLCWIVLAWPAIQDDALIHLRYADNLFRHHFVTYDGVHQDYGASSLLYITLLALLRAFTTSPNLPHALSSVVHLLLFAVLALAFATYIPTAARTARIAALILLALLAMPSAMRWLDDGMETGIVVAVATLIAWLVHRQRYRSTTTGAQYLILTLTALFAVLLRTELLLLLAVCFLILVAGRSLEPGRPARMPTLSAQRLLTALPGCSHILLGAAIAVGTIVLTMHVLLPDTAIAKSHGITHWRDAFVQTAITLAGALSFGIGMLLFWLLTLALVVLRERRLTLATLLANALFPAVLLLSSLRGQEIQGVRYFSWTFFFSIVWNILELARTRSEAVSTPPPDRWAAPSLYAFAALLAIALPSEVVTMHRLLAERTATIRTFESQRLDVLQSRRGIAFDIGYIGYFTGARMCDIAGLVSGRAAARLSSKQRRLEACLGTSMDFAFLSQDQLESMARIVDMSAWQSCGHYDLANVHNADRHYLAVRPALVQEVCRATGQTPIPVTTLLPAQTALRSSAQSPFPSVTTWSAH